jgi:DNA replication and repair protein RecF
MKIKKLRLLNFRNHRNFETDFAHTNIIFGPNASGKTNLLEAIYLLSTARAFKAKMNQDLISFGESFSKIKGIVEREEGELSLEVLLKADGGFKKEVKINDKSRRLIALFGLFLTVLFTPESLELVLGPPSVRRHMLDLILFSVSKKYTNTLIEFLNILKQRNKLLSKIKEGKASTSLLGLWDEGFVKAGLILREERMQALNELNNFLPKNLRLNYLPSPAHDLEKGLEEVKEKEIEAGFSLIGPQKDNFIFEWNKRPLALFGSRGEVREGVVLFKLAEWEFLRRRTGALPVLLLDDVFSELDKKRREMLSGIFEKGQIILTTTSLSYLNPELIKRAKVIELK